ncbi:hypothetical protein MIND_00261000 [Mycena indigotica]|uniref:Uncharacterized protein n=1 Tax=Mycena indigotica TaxID=2126181 RepID=A0A8H6WHH3_9AGAR|nr:uncharacterized protein MIND_00261000 [Mycena indigotica]KAF7312474.1 hypothetical protein MIND_00261000 [Mycena indigotica]
MDSASVDGSVFDAELSTSPSSPPNPDDLEKLRAMDQYRMNLWILTQRDRPIPSMDDMKKYLDRPQDNASRRRRAVQELDEQFEEDLNRMYLAESEDYLKEAHDRYRAFENEIVDRERLEEAKAISSKNLWDHVYSHVYTTYQLKKGTIEGSEALLHFPQTPAGYKAASVETQQAVAEFLSLTTPEDKEIRLAKHNWTWWQTNPLEETFDSDPEFKDIVQRVLNAEPWSRDPRRRTSI